MASSIFCLKALALIALALCVQGTLGLRNNVREARPRHLRIRGVVVRKTVRLEKHVKRSGEEAYTCGVSDIEADNLNDVIESDECVKACGLERKTLGISSDPLLESRFTQQLCSPNCYDAYPNVIEFYFNLAAGEGVFLPKVCEVQAGDLHRGMAELQSSGFVVAEESLQSAKLAVAPIVRPAQPPF